MVYIIQQESNQQLERHIADKQVNASLPTNSRVTVDKQSKVLHQTIYPTDKMQEELDFTWGKTEVKIGIRKMIHKHAQPSKDDLLFQPQYNCQVLQSYINAARQSASYNQMVKLL